jgi:hypothetical protein
VAYLLSPLYPDLGSPGECIAEGTVSVLFFVLLISVGLQGVTYKWYLTSHSRSLAGITAIFLLAFTNVMLATYLVIPLPGEHLLLQLSGATIVAIGSAVGAHKARLLVLAGLSTYKRRGDCPPK